MADFVFTVSEVNGYVKKVLEAEDLLQRIKIRGEISNYSKSYSGHVYFTLKDEMASVQCVWFSGASKGRAGSFNSGDRVQITANVTLYIKGGTYQLIVSDMQKDGVGDLYERFQKLKKQLEEEGLFNADKKKSLPMYPKTVGVITSATGAAIQDITRVLDTSWGNVTMMLYPVSVQGENAASQMIDALDWFDNTKSADVIIIGRGGGSFEDLNCFNDEALVRMVSACSTPIISAVGHETDFTLCDFAADVREATPSTAAKRAVPQKDEELQKLYSYAHFLRRKTQENVERSILKLSGAESRLIAQNPKNLLLQYGQQLDVVQMKIVATMNKSIDSEDRKLGELRHIFSTLNPKNTLNRGYAIIESSDGSVITDKKSAIEAKKIIINMKDGKLSAEVGEEINER